MPVYGAPRRRQARLERGREALGERSRRGQYACTRLGTRARARDQASREGRGPRDTKQNKHDDPTADKHASSEKSEDPAGAKTHGEADKAEADKPTSDKSHQADDAAHHDGDTKSTKDKADTHKSDKDDDGKSDKDDDGSGTGDDDPPITTEEEYLAKQERLADYDHGIVPKEQRTDA